jgi:hypothetical protein
VRAALGGLRRACDRVGRTRTRRAWQLNARFVVSRRSLAIEFWCEDRLHNSTTTSPPRASFTRNGHKYTTHEGTGLHTVTVRRPQFCKLYTFVQCVSLLTLRIPIGRSSTTSSFADGGDKDAVSCVHTMNSIRIHHFSRTLLDYNAFAHAHTPTRARNSRRAKIRMDVRPWAR